MAELICPAFVLGYTGVEYRPQAGVDATVVADDDLAGLGQFLAKSFDAVVEGAGVGGADMHEER